MCLGKVVRLFWSWQDLKGNGWGQPVVGVVGVNARENQERNEEEVEYSASTYWGGSCHKIQVEDPEMDRNHVSSCLDKPHRRSLQQQQRRTVLAAQCPERLTVLRLRMRGRERWRHYTHLSRLHR